MKIPVSPPDDYEILSNILAREPELFSSIFPLIKPEDEKGRYLHWDKLRHLPPPFGLSSEQWWAITKYSRSTSRKELPLADKRQMPFCYSQPDSLSQQLHWLDRHAAGNIQSDEAIANEEMRDTYLISSLMEEAISSSQLEGASTTRVIAKDLIRRNTAARDKSEQMIINNYHAMQFINENKNDELTPSMVFELQQILTQNTLKNEEKAGQFRSANDDIHVIDNASQSILHTPPPTKELTARLDKLCKFANAEQEPGGTFLHPVVKAITLHFMLAYDHPFFDGNGRTARALFYWCMAREGYWLIEFISISKIIKQAPAQYSQAFLYTETDDNDLTYFILHQLKVIQKAIEALQTFLVTKTREIENAEALLNNNQRLRGKLNFRQLALLRHALKHPGFTYTIVSHHRSHGVSYDIGRKDLLQLSDKLKLLVKSKEGKTNLFLVPADLEQRIKTQ